MRNLFATAVLLTATSYAFDYEAIAQSPTSSFGRQHQRSTDRLNNRGGFRPSWRYAPRSYDSGSNSRSRYSLEEPSQTSSHQRNPWLTNLFRSNDNHSESMISIDPW